MAGDPAKEHQLILRLPKVWVAFRLPLVILRLFQDHAQKVREGMKADTLGERLQIEFHSEWALFGTSIDHQHTLTLQRMLLVP